MCAENRIDWNLPINKADLLQRVEREWAALQERIAGLSDEEAQLRREGGWLVKDHLAHLAQWERYLRLHHIWGFPGHEVMGVDQRAWRSLDEDGLNAIIRERYRDKRLSEVVEALNDSHRGVLRELKLMPFAMMLEPAHADNPEGRPLLAWIAGNTYEHYREHRAAIMELIAPTSSRATLKAQMQQISCTI
jgi:hypothetical protein